MESRDIYNPARRQIEWEDKWIHIGTGNDIKYGLLKSEIWNQFENHGKVLLKRGRRNSRTLHTSEVLDGIMKLIGKEDFDLWNEKFSKAIKFNKIGVMCKSKYPI